MYIFNTVLTGWHATAKGIQNAFQLSINSINKCITCDSETSKQSLNAGVVLYGKRKTKFPNPEIVTSFPFNTPIRKDLTESKYPSDQIKFLRHSNQSKPWPHSSHITFSDDSRYPEGRPATSVLCTHNKKLNLTRLCNSMRKLFSVV